MPGAGEHAHLALHRERWRRTLTPGPAPSGARATNLRRDPGARTAPCGSGRFRRHAARPILIVASAGLRAEAERVLLSTHDKHMFVVMLPTVARSVAFTRAQTDEKPIVIICRKQSRRIGLS